MYKMKSTFFYCDQIKFNKPVQKLQEHQRIAVNPLTDNRPIKPQQTLLREFFGHTAGLSYR